MSTKMSHHVSISMYRTLIYVKSTKPSDMHGNFWDDYAKAVELFILPTKFIKKFNILKESHHSLMPFNYTDGIRQCAMQN